MENSLDNLFSANFRNKVEVEDLRAAAIWIEHSFVLPDGHLYEDNILVAGGIPLLQN